MTILYFSTLFQFYSSRSKSLQDGSPAARTSPLTGRSSNHSCSRAERGPGTSALTSGVRQSSACAAPALRGGCGPKEREVLRSVKRMLLRKIVDGPASAGNVRTASVPQSWRVQAIPPGRCIYLTCAYMYILLYLHHNTIQIPYVQAACSKTIGTPLPHNHCFSYS